MEIFSIIYSAFLIFIMSFTSVHTIYKIYMLLVAAAAAVYILGMQYLVHTVNHTNNKNNNIRFLPELSPLAALYLSLVHTILLIFRYDSFIINVLLSKIINDFRGSILLLANSFNILFIFFTL